MRIESMRRMRLVGWRQVRFEGRMLRADYGKCKLASSTCWRLKWFERGKVRGYSDTAILLLLAELFLFLVKRF